MTSITARGLTLDFPVYSVQAKTLRSAMLGLTVGGKLLKTNTDMTVVRALSNIQFSVKQGDRLGIIGHNGSGKTSLLKTLAGVYEPTQGLLDIQGRVSSMLSISIGLDHEATGLQNMRTLIMMQSMSRKEVERKLPDVVDFSGLGQFVHMPFKTYSAGMMARLIFSVGTSMDAEILIMDEWLSAGDTAFKEKAVARMEEYVAKAGLVVIASHDLNMVKRICNKVLVLNGGQTEFMGTVEEWLAQSEAA